MVAKTVDMPGLPTMEGVSAVPEQVPDLREELRGLAVPDPSLGPLDRARPALLDEVGTGLPVHRR